MKRKIIFVLLAIAFKTAAQSVSEKPAKVSHAEPIYFDLIRDLGARKGEKELNVGMGMASFKDYTQQTYFIEYEFAPVNRLGLEIELPFVFHPAAPTADATRAHRHNGLEGIKAAFQYSFFVSEKWQTTMAFGYIFENLSGNFKAFSTEGSIHNPFFVVARRWGRQIHTMVYTGPAFEYDRDKNLSANVIVNTSIHYVLPGTKNFVGIETNEKIGPGSFEMMVRPQIKLKLSLKAALGLAVGVPVGGGGEKMDFLFRFIYEPTKKIK
jgi:hypothetical protein